MEAADQVAEEEAAPANHSRNAVIESLPVQLVSSSSSPLPQLGLSSPPPTMSALISGLLLPQPALSSPQLGSLSPPGVLPSPQLPSLPPLSEAPLCRSGHPQSCARHPQSRQGHPLSLLQLSQPSKYAFRSSCSHLQVRGDAQGHLGHPQQLSRVSPPHTCIWGSLHS